MNRVVIWVAAVGGLGFACFWVLVWGTHCQYRPRPETGARVIRGATQNWRAANKTAPCPTVPDLVLDGELDSAAELTDPWGAAYKITCEGDEIFVRSLGPDGREHSPDDIVVPKQ
jgi:hypothetical protein